jgi:ABC-type proline/glycine betaine transport system permease subunit
MLSKAAITCVSAVTVAALLDAGREIHEGIQLHQRIAVLAGAEPRTTLAITQSSSGGASRRAALTAGPRCLVDVEQEECR